MPVLELGGLYTIWAKKPPVVVTKELATRVFAITDVNRSIVEIANLADCTPEEVKAVYWREKYWRDQLKAEPRGTWNRQKGKGGRPQSWPTELMDKAVQTLKLFGVEAAVKETGIPANTIKAAAYRRKCRHGQPIRPIDAAAL